MRIEPGLPAHLMKTYGIYSPIKTHFREATCEEFLCQAYVKGWQTFILEGDRDLGDRQAHYIRKVSGRSFKEDKLPDGRTIFTFSPGQNCFREHRIRKQEVPDIYYTKPGDWRLRTQPTRRTSNSWLDDFANHQGELADKLERG